MCLSLGKFSSVKAVHNKKPKIAKEDINVYKILNRDGNKYTSYFRGMQYERDTLYTVPRFSKSSCISYGDEKHYGYINHGLHSYTKPSFLCSSRNVCIKMTIPKGTKYYISECGKEIVSLALKTPKQFKKIK